VLKAYFKRRFGPLLTWKAGCIPKRKKVDVAKKGALLMQQTHKMSHQIPDDATCYEAREG